jgi:DNA-binding NarL/FixJ family response regulator
MVSERRPRQNLAPASGRARALARFEGQEPLSCLLAPLHRERALSNALLQHLSDELPDVVFTLEESDDTDVLWVCGYERGQAELIRTLRQRHPQAKLLVTARAPVELWSAEVLDAGADDVLCWPADLRSLGRALRRRPLQRRA